MGIIIFVVALLTAAFSMGAVDAIQAYITLKNLTVIDSRMLDHKKFTMIIMSLAAIMFWISLFIILL